MAVAFIHVAPLITSSALLVLLDFIMGYRKDSLMTM